MREEYSRYILVERVIMRDVTEALSPAFEASERAETTSQCIIGGKC